jgi:hypothetical protein
MRYLLLLAAVFAASTIIIAGQARASAWNSNVWRNPTGNIACRYNPGVGVVQCMTHNDGFTLRVRAFRGADVNRRGYVYVPPYAPTLAYGYTWDSGGGWGLHCTSRSTGMRCWNNYGHGFMLKRYAYRIW